jgi:hypothetical protein
LVPPVGEEGEVPAGERVVVCFVDQVLKVRCLHKCIPLGEVSGHITLGFTCCRKPERRRSVGWIFDPAGGTTGSILPEAGAT